MLDKFTGVWSRSQYESRLWKFIGYSDLTDTIITNWDKSRYRYYKGEYTHQYITRMLCIDLPKRFGGCGLLTFKYYWTIDPKTFLTISMKQFDTGHRFA